ncbi:hypothetical protein [Cognatishimia activa]|uniref:hypothetical protein n=1 Tax=Cognatishimia activa TaxID=1715691 RepID=UPI00223022EF|nr:hypothetical protein [Cognatishimia activa]UZD90093.1 hypothetical protein M0D42_10895 [Cognatishimia activa]
MFADQPKLAKLIWLGLAVTALIALFFARWQLAFVSTMTLMLSMAPVVISRWANVRVPDSFVVGVVLFVGGTLFLGEVFDFYERYWWWDVAMHGGSAVAFGLTGFLLIFMMFQGDRYAAPPFGVAVFAFCFAVTIGVAWEVFEFSMDRLLGLNMQKSGLSDTMGDLIVDAVGAGVGAAAGYLYLHGRERGGLTGIIDEFVRRNPRFFRRRK